MLSVAAFFLVNQRTGLALNLLAQYSCFYPLYCHTFYNLFFSFTTISAIARTGHFVELLIKKCKSILSIYVNEKISFICIALVECVNGYNTTFLIAIVLRALLWGAVIFLK